MLVKRSLKEWCGGCDIFTGNKCKTPILNRGWQTCPCRDCLIKTMCLNICDDMRNHKHEIANGIREKWNKKHGRVGEAG